MHYALLFLLCSLFDVISHALKESIVRSQPLNQEKFNFKISVAQLVVGIIMTPFILQLSKNYEEYGPESGIDDPQAMGLSQFMGTYFSNGFSCLFGMEDRRFDRCEGSFFYLLGYVFSLFVLQVTLTYVSADSPGALPSVPLLTPPAWLCGAADEHEEDKARADDLQRDGPPHVVLLLGGQPLLLGP